MVVDRCDARRGGVGVEREAGGEVKRRQSAEGRLRGCQYCTSIQPDAREPDAYGRPRKLDFYYNGRPRSHGRSYAQCSFGSSHAPLWGDKLQKKRGMLQGWATNGCRTPRTRNCINCGVRIGPWAGR